MTRYYRRLQQT